MENTTKVIAGIIAAALIATLVTVAILVAIRASTHSHAAGSVRAPLTIAASVSGYAVRGGGRSHH